MRELAWQLAHAAREAGAIVIAHGSDATDHAKEYLQNGADFVLVGEAEQSLVKLCASLLSGGECAAKVFRASSASTLKHNLVQSSAPAAT